MNVALKLEEEDNSIGIGRHLIDDRTFRPLLDPPLLQRPLYKAPYGPHGLTASKAPSPWLMNFSSDYRKRFTCNDIRVLNISVKHLTCVHEENSALSNKKCTL